MLSETEIRRHVANLNAGLAQPCSCRLTGHSEQCQRGAVLMAVELNALEWALGEGDKQYIELVKVLDSKLRDHRQYPGSG